MEETGRPGYGVGYKGRKQVTEVSRGKDFDTGRRAQRDLGAARAGRQSAPGERAWTLQPEFRSQLHHLLRR